MRVSYNNLRILGERNLFDLNKIPTDFDKFTLFETNLQIVYINCKHCFKQCIFYIVSIRTGTCGRGGIDLRSGESG